MSDQVSTPDYRPRALRLWLLAVAAMIFVTLVVGGATRLTVSGLSIVEWKPVTGVLPPMTDSAWQAEFEKYQEIPQYRELNRGMRVDQFKVIYYWEWSHRLLARATGAVFLLPFLFFLWRGWIPPPLRLRLWTIFGAGALLGVVGWWMVASGLADSTLTKVSQYRLAFHMTFACAIYAAVLWTAQQIAPRPPREAPWLLRLGALALAALLLAQIYLGALVAGLDAGLKYNTWPLMDGGLMPSFDRLLFLSPLWRNLFENDLMVQFNHRMLADGIWALSLLQVYAAWRLRSGLRGAIVLAVMVTLQAALGIVTLLYEAPLALALAHQIAAIAVFTYAVVQAERLTQRTRFGVGADRGGDGMIDSKLTDGIAVLTLMHGKANALDIEFCEALSARFQELRTSAAKAVVITGQGRMFCAGVDLKRLSEGGADYIRQFLPALHKLYDTVFFHPKPVVAAINGHAIAGGAVLAACADRRIMARDSGRIGVTEMLVGVPFPALAFEIVRFAVPARHLSEFTLTGATYTSDAALRRGWIDEVAEPDELLEDALAVAQELALLSPPAFAQTKSQIRQPVSERMAASGQATNRAVTDIWTTPATLARIGDYVARTLKK